MRWPMLHTNELLHMLSRGLSFHDGGLKSCMLPLCALLPSACVHQADVCLFMMQAGVTKRD